MEAEGEKEKLRDDEEDRLDEQGWRFSDRLLGS